MRENKALGLILPDDDHSALGALCDTRMAISIPFGGRYRIIDFTLSSMIHAGIDNIGVVTRNKYRSLMDHLGSGSDWDLARKQGGLALLPPVISDDGANPAMHSAMGCLSCYTNYIKEVSAKYVIMAQADIVGIIDFEALIEQHRASGATMTVVWQWAATAEELGEKPVVLTIDQGNRVTEATINSSFKEKCKRYMGICIMEKSVFLSMMDEMISRNLFDFEKEIIQGICATTHIAGFEISDCVKIQNIAQYYNTSMMLLDSQYRQTLFYSQVPIITRIRDVCPVRYGLESSVKSSLIADGAVIEGTVENSIIFREVEIAKGATVKNSIVMSGTKVSKGACLSYVVADRNCYINEDVMITGHANYPVVISKGSIV